MPMRGGGSLNNGPSKGSSVEVGGSCVYDSMDIEDKGPEILSDGYGRRFNANKAYLPMPSTLLKFEID